MEKLFPSAGCFTTAKQVQGRTLIGLHALRTSVSLLICFLLALDLLQNEEMLSLCVTLSWSASNFSSSATHCIYNVWCNSRKNSDNPLVFIMSIPLPLAHLIYPAVRGHWMNLVHFWWEHPCGLTMGMKGEKKRWFSLLKRTVLNKRAKGVMSLSTGDKVPTLCSADVCYIFRLNWLWFKALLISNTSPIYIWKYLEKQGFSWVWTGTTDFVLWKDTIVLNSIEKV